MEALWILTAGYTRFLSIQSSATLTYNSLVPLLFKGQPHLVRLFSWCPGWKLVSLRMLNSLRYWKIFNNYYQSQNIVTLEVLFLKKNFWSEISDLPLYLICHMDIKKHKVLIEKHSIANMDLCCHLYSFPKIIYKCVVSFT